MAIDLKKNKEALEKAYNQITDNKDDTNWVIFGYEGQTPFLKVVGTGDGGIDEMSEDLSSGKMLYAYCRVNDPNTALDKYVLIHWSGESVPENVKLKYTTHLRDIQAFVKAVHVTVVARTETDIDEGDIIKRVSKASGANYSFHKEKAKPEEAPAPVGTDYKRVRPDREINLNDRDKFWSQTEKDEISRRQQNKSKMEEERKTIEDARKDREQQEAKDRDKRETERMTEISHQKAMEQKADQRTDREEEKKKWAKVQQDSCQDDEERGHRSDQMRRVRVAEAAQLVSSSTAKSRDFFKQKSVERPESVNRGPPPPRKIIREFGSQDQPVEQPPARKEPIQLPRQEEEVDPPSPPQPAAPAPAPQPEQQPEEEEDMAPTPAAASPPTRNLLKEGLPPTPRQDSDPEDDRDQDWDEPPAEDFTFRENRQPSFHESAEEYHPETESKRISSTQKYPDETQEEPESFESVPAATTTAQGDQGLCAKALYDYQAADDTEITFDPDDIITNIEQIDEGWWQGFSPDGSYGMFPANYVELIS